MWFLRQAWLPVSLILIVVGLGTRSPAPAVAGTLVLLTGASSRLWAHFALRRLTYEVELPVARCFEGEELDLALRIANDKPQPLPWVEVTEQFPEGLTPAGAHLAPSAIPGYAAFRRSTSLGWYERVTWRYRLRCGRRGFYRLGPATIRSGDIFGLFSTTREVRHRLEVTVYPRLYELAELGLPADRPFGESRGGRPLLTDPTRIRALRPYRAGDTLRQIDWKATARRRALVSRQYEPAVSRHLLVALNADTMLHTWEGYVPEMLERAVSAAGSVARHALANREAAGLVTNGTFPGSDRPILVPPGRGPDQLGSILGALAAVQPLTMAGLDRSLAVGSGTIPRGSTIVVVTALMRPELAAELARLRDAGHRVALLWVADTAPGDVPDGVVVHDISPAMRRLEREAAA